MNISAKTEYACIAVLELAANYGSGDVVQIRKIAEAHGIPSRFLVQILLQLKAAGMVGSTRGAAGGYQLLIDPADITLGQVMAVVEGRRDEPTSSTAGDSPMARVLLDTWGEISAIQRDMLSAVTFADLVEQTQGQAESMYYI